MFISNDFYRGERKKPNPCRLSLAVNNRSLFSLADGAEELHLLKDLGADGFVARLEELTRIVAFFLVLSGRIGLALGAIFDGRFGEDELAVGVDVDLGDPSLVNSTI